jgi:catechol 2,3-dioxygenase-like lactoylglutathione lyase family enzyme
MKLERIDHVALRCASPEATMTWYVSTLGFERVFAEHWSSVPIFLRLGSTFIALFPRRPADDGAAENAISHLALRATSYADFQDAQTELRGRSISFEFQDHDVSHSIYFRDPDGFQLEITTYDVADHPRQRHRHS